jgi:hypothetical protein
MPGNDARILPDRVLDHHLSRTMPVTFERGGALRGGTYNNEARLVRTVPCGLMTSG